MVKNHKFGTVWQRALAVFSLNDAGWGRGAGKDGESGDTGSEPDKGTRGGERPSRNEQNRPPNGGREGGGPPDLDELWRDFNQRLNRLFNRKGGGNGKSPLEGGRPSGRAGSIGALVLLGLAVLIWLGSGIYIVQEGQAGAVLRFGRYVYTTPAGIQWRAPYPFESNEIVNMSQVRSIEIGRNGTIRETNLKDSSMLTSDGNIIDVRFAVQYRIKDASDFLFNNADAEANVAQAAETAVREIVGKSKMDYVLYEGREQVAIELAASIQRILDAYATGILVTSVTMQNVQPPEQVQAAFDDAVKAGQDRERQKNEAQAYANDVVPRARGTAARMLEEAQGYKARIVAQAEGDAARFDAVQTEYAKAPAVTRERLYLDTMQQIYSKSSKVLVDSKANNSMLYLPLDKLLSQPGQAPRERAPAAASADGASDAAVNDNDLAAARTSAGVDPLRSRSLFRSRGRSEEPQDIR